MRKANQIKHVFCLEGLWEKNPGNALSFQPILELIHHLYKARLKYIYKDCSASEELEDYLVRWVNGYKEYPILYLAFRVSKQHIQLKNENYSIDQLSQVLKNKCKNRIIIFGLCGTFDIDKQHIKRFIKETGCLSVCDYKADISWIKPTSFELLIMDVIQGNEFSEKGIDTIARKLNEVAINFKELDFRIVTARD